MTNIESVIDRWNTDPAFRAAVRSNPEGAIRAAGISLSADEATALKSVDWSQSDDQLMARITKDNNSC